MVWCVALYVNSEATLNPGLMSARTYSEDRQRRRCGSNRLRKYGHPRGRQPYSCGDCHCKFTPEGNRSYYSEAVKRQALSLHGEGMSVSAISGMIG